MTNGIQVSGDMATRLIVAALAVAVPALEVFSADERGDIRSVGVEACDAVQDLRGDIIDFLERQPNGGDRDELLRQADLYFRQPDC